MRKFTLLMAIVAVAAAPSLASAKTTKPPKAKAPKVEATNKDLNANTGKLFADMFAPPPAPKPAKGKKK